MAAALAAGLATLGFLALAAMAGDRWRGTGASVADITFIFLLSLSAAAEAVVSSATLEASPPPDAAGSASARVLGVLTGLSLLVLSAGPLLFRSPTASTFAVALGALLMSLGAALRVVAIRQLGPRFSSTNFIAPGARLERAGLYRLFAHPSEVGLLLVVVGGLLLVGNPAFWLLALVFYALTVLRITLEERGLRGRHGPAYTDYRARTFDPLPTMVSFLGGEVQ